MKYQGSVTISRVSSSSRDYVSITLKDDLSRCEVVEIKLSILEFGEALSGLALRPCEFEYSPETPVGKIRETKTELVTVPSSDHARDAVAAFEIDGWIGYDADASNSRCRTADGRYRVSFHRFVDAEVK